MIFADYECSSNTVIILQHKSIVVKTEIGKCIHTMKAHTIPVIPGHFNVLYLLSLAFNYMESLNLEAGRVTMSETHVSKVSWWTTLSLAIQSIGLVYGDISTSPLYVYSSVFTSGIKNNDDILGVLSLIIYTILLIPLLKYAFIVLWANDNGNGGAFALYSLICRHIEVSLIPNQQPEDRKLSNYKLELPSSQLKRTQTLKQMLENSQFARILLLLATILGTSMVIGDGFLTPSMSVLSAVSGISKSLGQGSEAMFADLGHFNVRAIQISFTLITCPAILSAYIGQAAFLRKFPEKVGNAFYESLPNSMYWPTFVVAVGAAIIASQAMISGAFSIISQALSLGCFPRVKVVHTSAKHEGQVYIPEINYMFMIGSIIMCAAFKTTEKISQAYGIAVIGDMLITTWLVSLIMVIIWKKSIWQATIFLLVFGFIEVIYFSSQITKFMEGGYVPIMSSLFLTMIMGIWHYVHKERYMFEFRNKVCSKYIGELAMDRGIKRVPGVGLLYSDFVQGIPPIFPHLIACMSSIHSVLVFVSIKVIPISRVSLEERFLFCYLEPREYRMFHCVVRCGYKDKLDDALVFESQLIQNLKAFIHLKECEGSYQAEVNFIDMAMQRGVMYMLGEVEVVAQPNSSFLNKIVVNYAYTFLRKNFRQRNKLMGIPPKRLLKIGMTYEI
ncbi:potassium transporter 5 isoform X1 [Arachis hypogaea]|uniref:potassium transporter 5 isoform X1 n=2 Tax=Arachis hypogaea TaxID=3818 RepID=UPI000DEC687E|nr:potassium transporter 5 [Arachis hypogaea]